MKEHSFMPGARPSRAPSPAKREAILAAALERFELGGFAGTPVPEVAEAAGVAVGTIYRYFPGKAGLVNALYQQWKNELRSALTDGLELDRPARQVFAEMWRRLTLFAVEHTEAFAFLENHHHAPYLDDESQALTAEIDGELAELVTAWQGAGEVRAGDPEMLVATVYGAFVGAVRLQYRRGLPVTAELGAETEGVAWRLLACPSTS